MESVYLDGTKAADVLPRGPASLDIGLARLPLKAGWNALIVAVDRCDGNVVLELNSPQPVEVRPTRP